MPRRAALAAAIGLAFPIAFSAGAARAQVDLFSPQTVSAELDLRLSAGSGRETGWLDGGAGKTRYGARETATIANADLIWTPRLLWNLSATVDIQAQPDQPDPVGIGEAFVTYKPLPRGPTRWQARIGLLYPPVSQEHVGHDWHVDRTITPSAINSWIGEEVKMAAAELKVTRALFGAEASATAAIFGYNDTSGTLLSLRGWALGDVRGTALGQLPLPAMSAFMRAKQAPFSDINWELDSREGYYGRLDWRTSRASFNVFYYNSLGDRQAVRQKQWSWRTWFTNAGMRYQLTDDTELIAQAITGRTQMGFHRPLIWLDVDYQSAFLLLSRKAGDQTLTARIEGFRIDDLTFEAVDDNSEGGWSATLAWKKQVRPGAAWLIEGLHVNSIRPARLLTGLAPRQSQTVLQSSIRLSF